MKTFVKPFWIEMLKLLLLDCFSEWTLIEMKDCWMAEWNRTCTHLHTCIDCIHNRSAHMNKSLIEIKLRGVNGKCECVSLLPGWAILTLATTIYTNNSLNLLIHISIYLSIYRRWRRWLSGQLGRVWMCRSSSWCTMLEQWISVSKRPMYSKVIWMRHSRWLFR